MKEERLLSSDYDRVADAATPNLVGAGAAFVLELFDLKNPSVLPSDQHRDDCALFIDIQIDSDVGFSALQIVHKRPPFLKSCLFPTRISPRMLTHALFVWYHAHERNVRAGTV